MVSPNFHTPWLRGMESNLQDYVIIKASLNKGRFSLPVELLSWSGLLREADVNLASLTLYSFHCLLVQPIGEMSVWVASENWLDTCMHISFKITYWRWSFFPSFCLIVPHSWRLHGFISAVLLARFFSSSLPLPPSYCWEKVIGPRVIQMALCLKWDWLHSLPVSSLVP